MDYYDEKNLSIHHIPSEIKKLLQNIRLYKISYPTQKN